MNSSYRFAGSAAIASGLIGITAYVSLLRFLAIRGQDAQTAFVMLRTHDFGVILQFLFLIPVVMAFCKFIQEHSPNKSKAMRNVGIAALCFTVLFLLLNFPKMLVDFWYMFPQGIFGVWIIVACWSTKGLIPRWLRGFGFIVGLGLALVGIFPLGYALFVDSIVLHIPAPSDEAMQNIPINPANLFLHQILWIGSPMGVATLPLWTLLVGVIMLRKKIMQSAI